MNIKEHIEAGHYPRDDKGRALVPMRDGRSAAIISSNGPSLLWPIVGFSCHATRLNQWAVNGDACHGYDLLPPPPRKVKVRGYAVIRRSDGEWVSTVQGGNPVSGRGEWKPEHFRIVELTGEYEEIGDSQLGRALEVGALNQRLG